MGSFSDLKAYHSAVGRRRFWLTMAGTLGFIAALSGLNIWLDAETGWPDAYGFHCHGRGCTFTYLYHSSLLLRGGNAYEIALFLLIWLLPACLLGIGMYALVRRWRRNSS
jgi:uncharacterized membrane protein YhaH (DUF805 family)